MNEILITFNINTSKKRLYPFIYCLYNKVEFGICVESGVFKSEIKSNLLLALEESLKEIRKIKSDKVLMSLSYVDKLKNTETLFFKYEKINDDKVFTLIDW